MRIDDARRLATVSPILAAGFLEVCQRFAAAHPGCFLGVAQGYRTPEKQQTASASGASPANGTTSFSMHQHWPSLALDFAVVSTDAGYIADGTDPRYSWVGEEFKRLGFKWGGDWNKPDFDHVEISAPTPDRDSVVESYSSWARTVAVSPFLRV